MLVLPPGTSTGRLTVKPPVMALMGILVKPAALPIKVPVKLACGIDELGTMVTVEALVNTVRL